MKYDGMPPNSQKVILISTKYALNRQSIAAALPLQVRIVCTR